MQYGENRGIELSISYYHPLQNLFQMETSFVKSNQVMGVNRMDVSLGVVMANIKLPITVVKRRQTITSETKVYEPEPVKEPKPKKIKEPKPKKVKEPKPNKEPKPKKPKEPKPEKPAEKAAPDPKPAVPSRYDAAVVNQPLVIDNIYFELTKSDLLESSYKELEQVAEWMQANPIVEIRLEGHTDKIGDSEKNLMLSRERVNAVREYLIRKGINSARIATKGYGDTRLVCKPSPCEKNRRVELVVTKK
jgi:outer membrane protein OmpA-like peptidoglycan-associated protein